VRQSRCDRRLDLIRALDAHAADANSLRHGGELGLASSVPKSRKPVDICSSSLKPSAPLLSPMQIILPGLGNGGSRRTVSTLIGCPTCKAEAAADRAAWPAMRWSRSPG
jgi:hypothetical protein